MPACVPAPVVPKPPPVVPKPPPVVLKPPASELPPEVVDAPETGVWTVSFDGEQPMTKIDADNAVKQQRNIMLSPRRP
jgi:hypothetical protein